MLVATLVVVAIGSIAFARRGTPPDLKIVGKVSGTPTPTAQRPDAVETLPAKAPFIGSGSWVMSSLPTCFHERERISGNLTDVRSKFPSTSERVRPPSIVLSGDCTLTVRDHEVWISRGDDRLRVPPDAFLYREPGGLTLVYIHGNRAEIRRYGR